MKKCWKWKAKTVKKIAVVSIIDQDWQTAYFSRLISPQSYHIVGEMSFHHMHMSSESFVSIAQMASREVSRGRAARPRSVTSGRGRATGPRGFPCCDKYAPRGSRGSGVTPRWAACSASKLVSWIVTSSSSAGLSLRALLSVWLWHQRLQKCLRWCET